VCRLNQGFGLLLVDSLTVTASGADSTKLPESLRLRTNFSSDFDSSSAISARHHGYAEERVFEQAA